MPHRAKHVSKERILNTDGTIDSRAIQTSLDKLVDNSNAVASSVLSRARLIKDVTVTIGQTTVIKHGLGRELQGYIVVLMSDELIIYDQQSINPRKNTELWLTAERAAASATLTVLVF